MKGLIDGSFRADQHILGCGSISRYGRDADRDRGVARFGFVDAMLRSRANKIASGDTTRRNCD